MRYISLIVTLFSFLGFQLQATNEKAEQMRSSRYDKLSHQLAALSDSDIKTLLAEGSPVHAGIGGVSVKIEIDGIPIFVKQVPLNELESSARSTENVFGLPLYYQYGVGSAGFSAWRELEAHLASTKWVLAQENQNFPLLYHYRQVNNAQVKEPLNVEEYVASWDNSESIERRWRANHKALQCVVLFLEYVPETLHSWLGKQEDLDKAIQMVERNLLDTTTFMNAKGMLHFDAHFRNILTDGKQLYFSDFGLATCLDFALSEDEEQFFRTHQNYDRSFVVKALTNWIIANLFGKERVEEVVKAYATGKTPSNLPERLTPYLSSILKRYAPIALTMNTFLHEMHRDKTKQVPYPAKELEQLQHKTTLDFLLPLE